MAPKRGSHGRPKPDKKGDGQGLRLRHFPDQHVCELVHPRCARERAPDLEEVHRMLELGELDVARDELRYLLDGCHALLEGHKLLGEIALSDGDLELARGHLQYAVRLAAQALPAGLPAAPLAAQRPANRPFFEAGKALAWCLVQLGEPDAAHAVVERLRQLDPSDPLRVVDALGEKPATPDS